MSKKNIKKTIITCPACFWHLEEALMEAPCPSCGKSAANFLVKATANNVDFYLPEITIVGREGQSVSTSHLQGDSPLLSVTPESAFVHLWMDIYLSSPNDIIKNPEKAAGIAIEKLGGIHEPPLADYLKELYTRIAAMRSVYRDRDIREACGFDKVSFKIIEENESSTTVKGCIKLLPTQYSVNTIKNYSASWLVFSMCAVSLDITMNFVKVGDKWGPADLMPQLSCPQTLPEDIGQINEFIQKQHEHLEKLHKKMLKRKKTIKRLIKVSCIALAVLIFMILPYVITRNEGFPKLLAQVPMFFALILSYATIGIACLSGALAVLGGFGRAVTGSDEAFNGAFGVQIGIAIVAGLLYFAFSALLISLEYINPFTGELFSRLF